MTATDLIIILQALPPETVVVVDSGDPCGPAWLDVQEPEFKTVVTPSYGGYENPYPSTIESEKKEVFIIR